MKKTETGKNKVPRLKQCVWMQEILKPAMEEILGREVVQQLMGMTSKKKIELTKPANVDSVPSIDVCSIQTSLENMYGTRTGRGLMIRIGRACFTYLQRFHASDLGFTDQSFRLLPLSRKIDRGSELLATFITNATQILVTWEKKENCYTWQIQNDQGNSTKNPGSICMLVTGMLQGAFYWMSSGRTYIFNNIFHHCVDGQACTIQIERIPIN